MNNSFMITSRFIEELANETLSIDDDNDGNGDDDNEGEDDAIDRELLFGDALEYTTAEDDSTLSVSSNECLQHNVDEVITLTDTEDDDCIIEFDAKKDNEENQSDENNSLNHNNNDNNDDECNEDDVEIVQVKYYNDAIEVDEDIEVLSQILTPTEVIDFMRHSLRLVQQTTGLSFTAVRVLMATYRWRKDHFVDEFHEIGLDPILRALKLSISRPNETSSGASAAKKRKIEIDVDSASCSKTSGSEESEESSQQITCLVCYDEMEKSQMYCNASCAHYLCIDCWNHYIATKVNDNASDDKILCPNDGCNLLMDDEELIALIGDQDIRNKYQRLISNKFVTQNDCLRWCPNRTCLHAVKVKYSGSQDIECVCKTVFCFMCGEEWHEPLSCDMFKNWIQKYASQTIDPNSAKWLTKHTKCCPKCKFPIEKNGGCNYVQCTKCAYSFCYHCLGKCSHGSCVGRNELDARAAQEQDQNVKLDLQLYPFYKDNYANQLRQLRLERQLQERVVHKLEKTVKSHDFKSALKFLKKAFSVLCHCRQTLMYSYVFDYYIKGPKNIKDIYGQNLGALERDTIQLSKILTSETTIIHKDHASEMKAVVQSNYRNCENSRSKLVHHIRQGLDNNLWQFISSNSSQATAAAAASHSNNALPLNLHMPNIPIRLQFGAGNHNIVVNALNRIVNHIWQPWQQQINNNVQ